MRGSVGRASIVAMVGAASLVVCGAAQASPLIFQYVGAPGTFGSFTFTTDSSVLLPGSKLTPSDSFGFTLTDQTSVTPQGAITNWSASEGHYVDSTGHSQGGAASSMAGAKGLSVQFFTDPGNGLKPSDPNYSAPSGSIHLGYENRAFSDADNVSIHQGGITQTSFFHLEGAGASTSAQFDAGTYKVFDQSYAGAHNSSLGLPSFGTLTISAPSSGGGGGGGGPGAPGPDVGVGLVSSLLAFMALGLTRSRIFSF